MKNLFWFFEYPKCSSDEMFEGRGKLWNLSTALEYGLPVHIYQLDVVETILK